MMCEDDQDWKFQKERLAIGAKERRLRSELALIDREQEANPVTTYSKLKRELEVRRRLSYTNGPIQNVTKEKTAHATASRSISLPNIHNSSAGIASTRTYHGPNKLKSREEFVNQQISPIPKERRCNATPKVAPSRNLCYLSNSFASNESSKSEWQFQTRKNRRLVRRTKSSPTFCNREKDDFRCVVSSQPKWRIKFHKRFPFFNSLPV